MTERNDPPDDAEPTGAGGSDENDPRAAEPADPGPADPGPADQGAFAPPSDTPQASAAPAATGDDEGEAPANEPGAQPAPPAGPPVSDPSLPGDPTERPTFSGPYGQPSEPSGTPQGTYGQGTYGQGTYGQGMYGQGMYGQQGGPRPGAPGHSSEGPAGQGPASGSTQQFPGGPPPGGPAWPYEPQPGSPGRRPGVPVALVVVIALVAALIGGGLGGYIGSRSGDSTVSLGTAPKGTASRAPTSMAGIAQRVSPSVVEIQFSTAGESGEGSGFIVRGGYIMTNNHVVAPTVNGGTLQVNFSDGTKTTASIVGRDPSYDIAVIKPKGGVGHRAALPLGNSDDVVVGDPVIAIGSPLGLQGTVTSGIISAKDRPVTAGQGGGQESYMNALQTDAAINPGNSGGPLVDAKGQVIGVNSAIRSTGGNSMTGQEAGSIGLGFAIPINQARQVAEQLIKTGHAVHPVIGVLIDVGYTGNGAKIAQKSSRQGPGVTPGGPADKAGLQPGDIITRFDGKDISGADQLIVEIRSHRPGDKVKVTYKRNGSSHTVTLTLGKSPH